MILPEEQARKKACPMYDMQCLTTECMAWRWAERPRETKREYHDAPTLKYEYRNGRHIYEGGWKHEYTDYDRTGRKFYLLSRIAAEDTPRLGYCGLAGNPER